MRIYSECWSYIEWENTQHSIYAKVSIIYSNLTLLSIYLKVQTTLMVATITQYGYVLKYSSDNCGDKEQK